jgi:hypothetical protein
MMSSLMELRSPALNINEILATNLMYGAAVCRLCYYRNIDPLPEAGDVEGQGNFWKKHYNTPLVAGTVPKYGLKVTSTLKG